VMAATNNAAGGKDPCFGQASGGGKREGMAGTRAGYFLHPHSPGCFTPPFGSRDAGY
jgi:hypothetical protein